MLVAEQLAKFCMLDVAFERAEAYGVKVTATRFKGRIVATVSNSGNL